LNKKVVAEVSSRRSVAVSVGTNAAEAETRKISPCAYQTEEEIAAYYRAAKIGDVVVVRQTQHHTLVYKVEEVEGVNPRSGRVYVSQYGAFYMKHGKNCFHPKGQTSLVVPTEEVLAWAKEHPDGEYLVSIYPPEKNAFLRS
jgi:environmental stress-induced protein Ves